MDRRGRYRKPDYRPLTPDVRPFAQWLERRGTAVTARVLTGAI